MLYFPLFSKQVILLHHMMSELIPDLIPDPYQEAKNIVQCFNLKTASNIALIIFVGSLCPITKGHVDMLRKAYQQVTQKGEFDRIIGLISVNSEEHVGRKINDDQFLDSQQDIKEFFINKRNREKFIELSFKSEDDLNFIVTRNKAWTIRDKLKSVLSSSVSCFEVEGADTALSQRNPKYQLWRKANYQEKMFYIVVGRSIGSGDAIDDVRKVVESEEKGAVDHKAFITVEASASSGGFSSTLVRKCIKERRYSELENLICPGLYNYFVEQSIILTS